MHDTTERAPAEPTVKQAMDAELMRFDEAGMDTQRLRGLIGAWVWQEVKALLALHDRAQEGRG